MTKPRLILGLDLRLVPWRRWPLWLRETLGVVGAVLAIGATFAAIAAFTVGARWIGARYFGAP